MKRIITQVKHSNGNVAIYSGTEENRKMFYECTVFLEDADAVCKRIKEFGEGGEMQTWIIKIAVANTWVADGFDFDENRMESLLSKLLPFATSGEVKGAIIAAPDKKAIRKLQGY